jgi:hypothetical protein
MLLNVKPIAQVMDSLPDKNVTTFALNALDFVAPGEWQNVTGFENMVRVVTGETNDRRVWEISRRAQEIYAATPRYQRALWLYQMVDVSDRLLAAASLVNKVGEQFDMLSFLDNLVPKSDTVQSIDLGLKLVVEVLAFGLLNGLPSGSLSEFAQTLQTYGQQNLMRMAALVCVDGLIPLGPDFVDKVAGVLDRTDAAALANNTLYQRVGDMIPGNTSGERLGFIKQGFASAQGWMRNLISTHDLTPERILGSLRSVINFSDDKLDYVGSFLDATTNYFSHTGAQTVARHVIHEAAAQVADSERAAQQTLAPAGYAEDRPRDWDGSEEYEDQEGDWEVLKEQQEREREAMKRQYEREREAMKRAHEREREAAKRARERAREARDWEGGPDRPGRGRDRSGEGRRRVEARRRRKPRRDDD